jgi:hypothetical protein
MACKRSNLLGDALLDFLKRGQVSLGCIGPVPNRKGQAE